MSLLVLFVWMDVASAQRGGHPLEGRIWDTREQRFLRKDELDRQLLSSRRILLGEVHDNRVQHRWQAALLEQLTAAHSTGTLVLEMFDRSSQPRLSAWAGASWEEAEQGLRAMATDKGWEWSFYAPLVRIAHEAGWRLLGGNLSRSEAMTIVRGEKTVAPAVIGSLPSAAREVLASRIDAGHCGLLSRTEIGLMVIAQQARDATLAEALEEAQAVTATATDARPVVLLAGNEHVRRDIGVPRYLASGDLLSIGFLEVIPGRELPLDYYPTPPAVTQDGRGLLPAPWDLIWFAPAQERSDPCEAFQRHRSG